MHKHATVGVYAIHMKTGEVLLDHNSDKSLIPGSCIKIVTTGAALHLLGPENRFETNLEYDGYLDEEGVLHGNLYIRGGGDPCLGSDRLGSSLSLSKQIESWVQAIEQAGVHSIEGNVIGDASKWEKGNSVPSWAWEDLGNYYGSGASALSFHENTYSLFFKPGKQVGDQTTLLRTEPIIPNLVFENEVQTGPVGSGDRACIYGTEYVSQVYIRGTIPHGVNEFAIKGSIPDPSGFAAHLLAHALQEKNISILHQDLNQKKERIDFHTTYSPNIGEIVHVTNQKSMNLYAEHLLKKMGEMDLHEGSTEAGIKAVTDFWHSQKMDMSGFNMADGSGLSRKNLITAKQLVFILQMMKNSDFFPIFFQSLPQEKESIRAKTGSTPIRAKTGSMSLLKGFAGYKGDIAFAILVNQCPDKDEKDQIIQSYLQKLSATNSN